MADLDLGTDLEADLEADLDADLDADLAVLLRHGMGMLPRALDAPTVAALGSGSRLGRVHLCPNNPSPTPIT